MAQPADASRLRRLLDRTPPGLRHAVRITLGISFLLLGLAGLVLPVLQGILFLMIGALLLAPYVPVFQRLIDWGERRYPQLTRYLERLRGPPRSR